MDRVVTSDPHSIIEIDTGTKMKKSLDSDMAQIVDDLLVASVGDFESFFYEPISIEEKYLDHNENLKVWHCPFTEEVVGWLDIVSDHKPDAEEVAKGYMNYVNGDCEFNELLGMDNNKNNGTIMSGETYAENFCPDIDNIKEVK